MFLFTYTAAFISTIFVVSAAVLFIRKRDPLHLALVAYLLTSALWIGGNAAADVSYTPAALILTSQLAYCGGILNLFCCMLLVDLLVDRTLPSWRRLLIYGIPCFASAIAGFCPCAIAGLAFPPNSPAQIVPGELYSSTIYVFMLGLAYCIARLVIVLRKETEYTRRMQLLYVLTGLMIVSMSELYFDLLLPVSGELRLFSIGPIASVFFAATCMYAITRHKLLDIRTVAQLSLIYSVLLAGLMGIYFGLTVLIGMLLNVSMGMSIFLSGGMTVLLGIFGAPVIERQFRARTDIFFFKDIYDYAEAMLSVSEILQTAGLNELVRKIEQELTRILRATKVEIVLSERIPAEVVEDPESLHIPIYLDQKALGNIHVGERRSGERYTERDIRFLCTFSNQAAMALSRVRLFEEVQKHAEGLEQKVAQRTAALEAMQQEQRRMMMDISHNLQTPLTILKARMEQLIQTRHGDIVLASVENSITSLSHFISELLALASLERALQEEGHAPFSLSSLVKDVTDEIRIIIADRNITLQAEIAEEVVLYGNEKRMREVLMNLMNNAIKYIGSGPEKVITCSLIENDGSASIQISDTGVGIVPADRERIFERFYRVPSVSESVVPGTGLGLSIVKQIVEQHAGAIAVTSTLGKGSTFTITLPTQGDLTIVFTDKNNQSRCL